MAAELGTIGDVAKVLGVSRSRADQLSRFAGFPAPVGTMSGGRVWDLKAIRRWMADTGRGAG